MRLYKSGTVWCFWRWTITDSEYITRLHLLKTPWFAICLHWINKPDPEPYLHDHPVSFLSIILRGGYSELRQLGEGDVSWEMRKSWNYVIASPLDRHRITHVEPRTLTLALMGPKVREWGYHIEEGGWMHWSGFSTSRKDDKDDEEGRWVHWKDYCDAQRDSKEK